MNEPIKRLYRSRTETRLAGVCGGLGVYFRIDPVFIRLAWLAITLVTGVAPGVVAYLVAWLLVPLEPSAVREAEVVRPAETDEGSPRTA